MVARVKKNDKVCVLAGKDRGKKGTVIAILPKENKIMISGIALVKKHVKARRQGEIAGIKEQESFIHISKVIPVCGSCNKGCRINIKSLDDGKTVRICNRCKETF
jgi:large subunit ribosomal protein L24